MIKPSQRTKADLQVDTFTFHMGVNATAVIGRIRVTAPTANSLSRLLKDGENAKAMALKLESDLIDSETDQEPPATDETRPGSKPYRGLAEKVSAVVDETIERLWDHAGLLGDEISDDQRSQKVSGPSRWFVIRTDARLV